MTITVKHKFVSAIPDAGDTTIVQPSNWNDTHDLTGFGTSATLDAGVANGVATLDSSGTVPLSQIPALGDLNYQGTWNATTNSPTLTSSVGTKGFYYVVSVAGTTSLNGITDWQIGDWAVFNGSAWQKIDNTDAVTSVNGYTGTVVLNAADVGAVPYTGATGAVDLNAKSLTNVSNLGVGTTTVPTIKIRAIGDNNSSSRIAMRGYSSDANSSAIRVTKFRGTAGAPQAPQSGDSLGKFELAGYGTTSSEGYPQASLEGLATEAWGATARGTKAVIKVTPNTTTTQVTALTINQDSTAVFANTVTANGTLLTGNTGTVTSVSGTGTVSGISLSGTVTSSGNLTLGGSLDLSSPPAIGATTPAAGTFTTITGQTEVLKGTGANLLLQSQAWATTPWITASGATVANNVTTAPDGTTTASKISEPATTTNFFAAIQNPTTVSPTARYTHSFYAKSAERTQAYISNSVSSYTVYFDLSTGTFLSASGTNYISSSIISVGNGWYRCSVTFTAATTANPFYTLIGPAVGGTNTYSSTLGNGIYVWGAQLEIGSTLNTYIPTTTTAIYGTPTLSFSGVAGLGLQSDGSLYVSPAGTGALQAQATTSSTVGGNARGANAVDWQTSRGVAGQVAVGTYSVTSGGYGNTANAFAPNISGGYNNSNAGGYSFIGGGNTNSINAGTISVYTAIVGGNSNTANGYYNFIGGGFTNSGTSITAVTTQSATMNGTTAVTLAATNANIKVGQYITGTSIAGNTYVAAISGTSLTLSQNASGSSTSTLSFYTPHGVVVGGGNNQATGSYSFIGGGGDAGTAANRNVASGDWSGVIGGFKNLSSGTQSFICAGNTNTASGIQSFIGGGFAHTASGNNSTVGGGYVNQATGDYSSILGGVRGSTRSIKGYMAFPAHVNPIADTNGVSQAALLVLGRQTTDATATVLTCDGAAASTTNQVILPNNSAYYFKGEVVSGKTAGGDTKGWSIEGVIKRGANAASTALVGTPTVTSLYADAGATTWILAVTADTTNGGITVTFTGQAATTIRTVCSIRTVEMTF